MMVRPFGISVVIPTYGRREEVMRALHSVSGDTRKVEIIVIDDHSPEDLRPLIPARNNHGIVVRTYRFSRNRGPQAARNLGIRRARFSHIAFLDSDDAFLPEKSQAVLAALEGGAVDVLIHAERGMERYAKLSRLWQSHFPNVPLRWLACAYNPVTPSALVVRRNGRLGIERLRHCEDYAFLLHYLHGKTSVRFLDLELSTLYRSQGLEGGLSGDRWKMRKGEFQARKVLLRRPTADNLLCYVVGTLFGCARVVNDLVRGRYL